MILAFELSMPNCNSWNGRWTGRWTGEGRAYIRTKTFRGAKSITKASELIGYHYYSFGDGWGAGVHVREVDSAEARRIRKKSAGFHGYDWMIESLLQNGLIKPNVTKLEGTHGK